MIVPIGLLVVHDSGVRAKVEHHKVGHCSLSFGGKETVERNKKSIS